MKIERVDRDTIDSWLIAQSGMPARIVHCSERLGARTIGEIRHWSDEHWLAQPHLGIVSLAELRRTFQMFDRMEKGKVSVQHVQELLQAFLTDWQVEILADRYGLQEACPAGQPGHMTLQSIANRSGHTRERIRQVQEAALQNLRSKPARLFAAPFVTLLQRMLDEKMLSSATTAEINETMKSTRLAPFRPSAIMDLLIDTGVEVFNKQHGFYSTLPGDLLGRLGQHAARQLARKNAPCTRTALLRSFPADKKKNIPAQRLDKALSLLLDANPRIARTRAGTYFDFEKTSSTLLADILKKHGKPMPLSEIVKSFNRQLTSASAKGVGFVRQHLEGPAIENCGIRLYRHTTTRPAARKKNH